MNRELEHYENRQSPGLPGNPCGILAARPAAIVLVGNSGLVIVRCSPASIGVGGGVKVVEKRRFENPAVISLERKSFGEV